MKNTALTILISVTLALVCALFVLNLTGVTLGPQNTAAAVSRQDVVTVYGQGKVSLKPDVAYLTCGYENIDINPKAAQDANAENMEKIINALKEAGIEEENIQTSQYSVNQEYDYNGGQKKILGYRITNLINVKISDVDKAEEIINTAINAGGNIFRGINFDIIERQQAYLDAMDAALERAKKKAQVYAEKEGRVLSGVLEINEGSAPTTTYRSLSLRNEMALSYASDASAALEGGISSGQVEITATVTVVYGMD